MRKLFLWGLVSLSIFVLAGCATMGAGLFRTEETWTFNIKVTSKPGDAEIYINDRLVGRTPSRKLPLLVKYDQYNYGVNIQQIVKEQYVLRVSKKGYKDAVMTMPVKNRGSAYALGKVATIGLYKTSFHFDLEPESDEIKEESRLDLDEDYNVDLEYTDKQLEGEI